MPTYRPRAVRVTHGNIQSNTDSIITFLGAAQRRPGSGHPPVLLPLRRFAPAHVSRRPVRRSYSYELRGRTQTQPENAMKVAVGMSTDINQVSRLSTSAMRGGKAEQCQSRSPLSLTRM
jgi:hypothetical protein